LYLFLLKKENSTKQKIVLVYYNIVIYITKFKIIEKFVSEFLQERHLLHILHINQTLEKVYSFCYIEFKIPKKN